MLDLAVDVTRGLRSRLTFLVRRPGGRLYSAGDSHSDSLSGRPGVRVLHFGPVTAFRAGRPGELLRLFADRLVRPWPRWTAPVLARVVVRPRDAVLLFFGEIDVRAHFALRVKEYGSAEEMARFLSQRLAAEARELRSRTGATVGIASVTPPVDLLDDENFPTRGSSEERRRWTRVMNQELAAACQRFGVVFVDSFEHYVDDSGRLSQDVTDGTVHIRQDASGALYEECLRQFPALRTS